LAGSPLPWIALNLLPGVGPILARRALERFGDPEEIAFRVPVEQLAAMATRPLPFAEIVAARRALRGQAERELKRAERLGVSFVVTGDEDYPAALLELPDPPVMLYRRGAIGPGVLRVAVVGSRSCTAYGKRIAAGLAAGLAARNIEVVSGGARGIDTCAHRGALEEGGRSIAVLGSGLARPYPEENRELFDALASSGALLSEFALDEPPQPGNFPRRNRLISALSAAVVVIEAAPKSGSLITAGHALEQGREVLAVPGPVTSVKSAGCHKLIQQGAKLVQNIEDVLEELSPMYRAAVGAPRTSGNARAAPEAGSLTPDEEAVLRMLDPVEPIQIDELAEKAAFGIARLQAALFGLEIRGSVEQTGGRYYLLRPQGEA